MWEDNGLNSKGLELFSVRSAAERLKRLDWVLSQTIPYNQTAILFVSCVFRDVSLVFIDII